ncbi:MAG: hypothetical protein ACI9DF_004972, partial [Verrucomicrobiales bacterium]
AMAEDDDVAFFEKHVRPLLATHCYECHSVESGKAKGGLLLDSRSGWEKGGDSGPALVPEDPEASLILRAVSYADTELQMPPKKRLPKVAHERLKEWVVRGAPDPRQATTSIANKDASTDDARDYWSFQPVVRRCPPANADSDWSTTPLDAFVEDRRSQAGLGVTQDADTHTLLRRLYVTLTGLPPSPEEIAAFQSDGSPNAMERLTDRLLASPRYGEHWGRHWLDVTRFAESSGGGRSLMFKNAWHFRDYVIRAMNEDVPFDTLIKEHVAGDLLDGEVRKRERLIGSGFLALGPTNYELQDKELLRMEVVDEQIDTMGRAFLGMTLGCARCHDHKFDPVSTKEYYALAGIFRSTKTILPGNVSGYVETPLPGPGYAEAIAFEREMEERKAALELAEQHDEKRAAQLKKELEVFKKSAPPSLPKAMTVREEAADEVADCHVRVRGAIRTLGETVPRGFLAVATPSGRPVEAQVRTGESGRRDLAEWMTHRNHPLTARVYVNRLWHHVFGLGLVRTVDNFGKTGETPSHPALLDYLASGFVSEGEWSTKRMVRTMVSSRTFQLGRLHHSEKAQTIDPENRLLWRAHERVLHAESLRDAMRQVAGTLDLVEGGYTIEKFSQYDNGYQFGEFRRRAVYAPAFRNARLEILNLFDAANPNMTQGRRVPTTLATQALFMMNSPFVMEQASVFADRLLREVGSNKERLVTAYLHILGRPPTPEESRLAEAFLEEFTSEEGWGSLAQSLFASVDFRSLY